MQCGPKPSSVVVHCWIADSNEANVEAGTTSSQKERPSALTLSALRGIVPAIPGEISSDFEDQIEEAIEAKRPLGSSFIVIVFAATIAIVSRTPCNGGTNWPDPECSSAEQGLYRRGFASSPCSAHQAT